MSLKFLSPWTRVSCRLHSWLKSHSTGVVLRVLEVTQLSSQRLGPVIVVLERPVTSVSSLDTAHTSAMPSSKPRVMLRLMPVALDKAGILRMLTKHLRCLQLLLHPLHRPPPLLAHPQRPRTLNRRPRVPRASGNLLEMQVFVPLTLPILFAHYNSMQMLTGMQTQVPLLI
jgi:hypothetical protein